MIHAYNILTGYMAIRGSLFLHLPMFIAQAIFVRYPTDLGDDGYEEFMHALKLWYWLALIMHFLLAFVHGLVIAPYAIPPAFEGV